MEKIRIRFQKAGDLRFLSHHDLMRLMERMLRRADIPFAVTEGFHPKPKMMFPSALALGIVGREEVVEIELRQPMAAEEVSRRLRNHLHPGLEILSVQEIPKRLRGRACQATYLLPVDIQARTGLEQQISKLLQASSWLVERQRPQRKLVDIRPQIVDLSLTDEGLYITLRLSSDGSARPEEVLEALGLSGLLTQGSVLERTRLVLADEWDSPLSGAQLPSPPRR